MTRVLADAQLRQRRLVADAGHELRTPLASLGNNISLLRRSRSLRKPLAADEEGRLLADLSSQVAELTRLVDDLSALAESDPGRQPFATVRFDECVERAVRRGRSRSLDHQIRVDLEPWTVQGDATALERAVVNLLDNALKFSPAGTEVEVSLSEGSLVVAGPRPRSGGARGGARLRTVLAVARCPVPARQRSGPLDRRGHRTPARRMGRAGSASWWRCCGDAAHPGA